MDYLVILRDVDLQKEVENKKEHETIIDIILDSEDANKRKVYKVLDINNVIEINKQEIDRIVRNNYINHVVKVINMEVVIKV